MSTDAAGIDWTRVDPRGFECLCSDLARAALGPENRFAYQAQSMPQQADFQCDGTVERCLFEKLHSPVVFSYKTSDPAGGSAAASKSMTSEFLKRLPTLLAQKPKSIVFWVNHDFRPRDRQRIKAAIPRGIAVRLEGRTELEQRLLQHPYLLTKYFGWSEFMECLSSDDHENIRRAVAGGPLAEAVPPKGVHHPNMTQAGDILGKCLRIIGGPGSGKSFFVYRLLSSLEDADIVVLRSLDRALIWDHIGQILRATRRHVVFVADNLHEYFSEGYSTDVLGPLIDSRKTRTAPVTILVAHWTAKRLDVEKAIPATQWATWGFREISLDDPPRSFIGAVVKAACERLEIEAEEGMRDAFAKEIAEWENTPACAVASLFPYRGKMLRGDHGFHPVNLKDRDATWRSLFADLSNTGTPEEPTVLRAMSVLRWCGEEQPALSAVVEVASVVGGALPERTCHAIERLEKSGWLQREGAFLRSHDLQILPPTVGLHDGGKPSLFLDRFARLVTEDVLPSLHTQRLEVLRHLGAMYWDLGQPERSIEFNDSILAVEPGNIRALCNRAVSLLKCGKTEEGIADFHRATAVRPGEIGPARLLYSTYRRMGRVDEAQQVLNTAECNLSDDPLGWAFLSQAYADLHENKKALKCALRLADLKPGDPEAVAVMIHALWMAGRRKRAKLLLDGALQRWPDEGVLLHVRADIEEQAGNSKNALVFAERALKACPNNPSFYALAAWLNMTAGNLDRAYEIAQIGTDLFKFWSDLLTVWGLLLEQKGELEDAERVLLRAVERSDHFSNTYRPNLLLALGRVSIRLGKHEEADRWFDLACAAHVERAFLLQTKADALRLAGRVADAVQAQQEAASIKPESAPIWSQLAQLCMLLDDHARAIEALEKVVSLNPSDCDHLFLLGVALKNVDRIEEAIATLRKVVELDATHANAWKELGICLYQHEQVEEAESALRNAIAKGADDKQTRLAYAWVLRIVHKPREAIHQCKKVQAREPKDASAYGMEAYCLLDQGKKKSAVRVARQALKIECGPLVWAGHVRLAVEVGLVGEAYELWSKGRSRGWTDHRFPRWVLDRFSDLLFHQRRDQNLMEVLECIHSTHGPDPTNMLNLARCAMNLRRLDDAVARYNELIRQYPLHLLAVGERAEVLFALKRHDQALNPGSNLYTGIQPWLAALHMAHAWVAASDLDRATDRFLEAVRLLPDPPDSQGVEMRRLVGIMESLGIRANVVERLASSADKQLVNVGEEHLAALLTADRDGRLRMLRASHSAAPERIHLALDLAMEEFWAGNRLDASRLARLALSLGTHTSLSLSEAGRVLYLSGAPAEETLGIAEQAIQIKTPPTSLWTALNLKAESLNALGRFEEALVPGREALQEQASSLTYMAVLRSLQALGRTAEAFELVDKASAEFPDDIEIKTTKALLLNLMGRDKECVELVTSMGAAGALMVTPLLDMGDCLLRAKRYGQARMSYQSARKNLQEVREQSGLRDFYVRAVNGEVSVLVAQRRHREALRVLDEVGDSQLIQSQLWLLRACLCAEHLRDDIEVLRVSEARLTAASDDALAQWYRATALFRLRRYDEALSALEQVVRLQAKDTPESLNLKARILASQNRFPEAIELVRQLIELRSKQEKRVDLTPVVLVVEWLPECSPPPASGLELATALLGGYCQHQDIRSARTVLKRLKHLDWQEVTAGAQKSQPVCILALALLAKAERWMVRCRKNLPGPTSDSIPPADTAPSLLVDILQTMVHEKWLAPKHQGTRKMHGEQGAGSSTTHRKPRPYTSPRAGRGVRR